MTAHWIQPDKLFDGTRLRAGMAAQVEGGVVVGLAPVADIPALAEVQKLAGILCPGFFDLQINGGGGVLFNTAPNRAGLQKIWQAHQAAGVRHWLPTVITDAPEVMQSAVSAVLETYGEFGVAGIHIEGPHIALARRGAHNPAFIRRFDSPTMAQLERLRKRDIPVVLTLAPEAVLPGQVAEISAMGVTVSIGHSDATAAEAQALVQEGALLFTHLFNAMSQIKNRAPGVVGAAINSEVYTSIIADGLHVDPSLLAMTCRARPVADRMILVSDAMPTVGGGDTFTLYDQKLRLRSGRLENAEGALAGAHITIAQEIAVMVAAGVELAQVLRMATSNPARLMGLESRIGVLQGARLDELILLGENGSVSAVSGA